MQKIKLETVNFAAIAPKLPSPALQNICEVAHNNNRTIFFKSTLYNKLIMQYLQVNIYTIVVFIHIIYYFPPEVLQV